MQTQAIEPRRPTPLQIEFHDVHPIDATERELLGTATRLARAFPELDGCRLLVEPARGSASYHALVELTFPPGRLEVALPPTAAANQHNFASLLFEALERGHRALAMHQCTHPPGSC